MKVELAKDKDGYTAKISGRKHLVAFGYTKQDALEELKGVVELELESEPEIRQLEKKIDEFLHKLEHEGQ
jgi:predicted RNase H-like HicB family nuclease